MLALTLASTAYTVNEQRKTAKRNERFARDAQKVQSEQAHTNRSRQADQRARQARTERSRLRALSAETGLAGVTTNTILRNAMFQGGQDVAAIQQLGDFDQVNSRFSLQSNLNQIQQPDYIGAALNSGLQIAQYNEAMKEAEDPTNATPTSP